MILRLPRYTTVTNIFVSFNFIIVACSVTPSAMRFWVVFTAKAVFMWGTYYNSIARLSKGFVLCTINRQVRAACKPRASCPSTRYMFLIVLVTADPSAALL